MLDANSSILAEQDEAADWRLWERATEVNLFVWAFQRQFFDKLGGCPMPVISYQNCHAGNLGSYRLNRNEYGLARQINVNARYLSRPLWAILATVFHEMMHAWEHHQLKDEAKTRTWHHKQAFRDFMEGHGIHCLDNGAHDSIDPHGLFAWFIKRHGVPMEGDEIGLAFDPKTAMLKAEDQREKPKRRTTEWACDCMKIRLPLKIEDFDARCNHCGTNFEPTQED